jgi:hypothetical protein
MSKHLFIVRLLPYGLSEQVTFPPYIATILASEFATIVTLRKA